MVVGAMDKKQCNTFHLEDQDQSYILLIHHLCIMVEIYVLIILPFANNYKLAM